MNIIAILDDHAGGKSTCRREMGNDESSWSGLSKAHQRQHGNAHYKPQII